jgi:asparagine synthase (glutamine-hydrolysing)
MCGIIVLLRCDGKSINLQQANNNTKQLYPRGPDASSYELIKLNNLEIYLGFTRLAIMDTSDAGMQPFMDDNSMLICNGEIYNYAKLMDEKKYETTSASDCEILLNMYNDMGITQMLQNLDAEYGLALVDKKKSVLHICRDYYGVRPLYYGYNQTTQTYGFASELKALHNHMDWVLQVPPTQRLRIDLREDIETVKRLEYINLQKYTSLIAPSNDFLSDIRNSLITAVQKRLVSDRPIGFLLSGGLDSSLIVAIASTLIGPNNVKCFTIGVKSSPDVIAAKEVATYLGVDHHIINFDIAEALASLDTVVKVIETYDVTTIRASTPQYMMARYIQKNTDIRVLLSGEGSDEIHGSYRYFRDAPDDQLFQDERQRLLNELTYFDNKRTDRTMAGNGLEVRIPFLDRDYVDLIMSSQPSLWRHNTEIIEKLPLRQAFIGYLPEHILMRSKEAFSDAVSDPETNWVHAVQRYAEYKVEYINNDMINPPMTKEGQLYRNYFDKHYFGRGSIIPHYWMPRFQKKQIVDPSATVLDCY